MGSVPRMTEPYRLALSKDWKGLENFYMEHNEAVGFPLTVDKDTSLHIAVHSGDKDLLKNLNDNAPYGAYRAKNAKGNTPLHEVAATGNVEMAKILLSCGEELVEMKNDLGETPLFRAAAFGRTKLVRTLLSKVKNIESHSRRIDTTTILHIAVLGMYFETGLLLLEREPSLGSSVDEIGVTCLQLLANMPSAFKSSYPMGTLKIILYFCNEYNKHDKICNLHSSRLKDDLEKCLGRRCSSQQTSSSLMYRIRMYIAQECPYLRGLWKIKKNHMKALMLAKNLAKIDSSWRSGEHYGKTGSENISVSDFAEDDAKEDPPVIIRESHISSPSELPLIAAARNGIVKAILKVYPQAIEQVNEQGENIFHIAARHRREEMLDLLQHSYRPISRLRRKINDKGDCILHQAAYLGEFQLRERPGEALSMQSEIQWFQRVKKIVPPYFINHKNTDKKIAEELFTIEHKDLLERGQQWLMRTTQASTLVAVLIATVAFTSAYTVPGGSNSKTGSPLLLNTTPFRVFTISDTLSLCFALSSVVVFLSIMTSNMHEQDFRMSLPLKLVMGLTTLFLAVAAMMVAFAATLVLMIQQRLRWAAIPIYSIACFPVTIFLALQFPLYLNIAWFTLRDVLHSLIDFLPRWKFNSTTSMSLACWGQ